MGGGINDSIKNAIHTLNSSANSCLFSGDGYTARPWASSLFLPTDFFTNTVSPRPPSSIRTNKGFICAEKIFKYSEITNHSLFDRLGVLQILTGYRLSQDELHLLLGNVFGVFHQLVDAVSSRVKPRRTAYFR